MEFTGTELKNRVAVKSDSLKWSKCKVLITGASGFIGSHLRRELVRNGAEVHAVSRREMDGGQNRPRWWRADLTNFQETNDLIEQVRPDLIYHLSSLAHGGRELDLVLPTLQNEVVATVNVLTAATKVGSKRVIMAGSLEEPETGDIPSSPYAAAKAASRSYGYMFYKIYGTPVVSTRIFMTYGPGQPDWKLIPYCILTLARGQKLQISSPDRKVDWIYVSDVIQGLVTIGHAPGLEGESLDFGSGTLVQIGDVVRMVRELVDPAMQIEFGGLPARSYEQIRCADVASTTARIGWSPQVGLEEGLHHTIEYVRAFAAAENASRSHAKLACEESSFSD